MDKSIRHRVLLAIKLIGLCILVIIFTHRGAWTQEEISSVPTLLEALENEDEDVRWAAVDALGQIGKPAVPALMEALENEDEDVRVRAALVLAEIKPEADKAVPVLIDALKNEDENVRLWAALVLAKIKPEADKAVPVLIDALKNKDEYVRWDAAHALRQIGKPAVPALMKALENEDEDVRVRAALVLAEIEPEADKAVPVLIDALKNKDVRLAAAHTLRQIGKPAVPALMKALENEDEDVRVRAALVLAEIEPEADKAVPVLIEALENEDEDVRWAAVDALGQIGKPAVPALIDALKNKDEYVRRDAAYALRQIGKPAVPALMKALENEYEDVRVRAALVLAAVPALIEALEDEDEDVRQIALEALVDIGSPSVPELKKAAKNRNFYVRRAALIALKQIKDYGDVRYQRRIVEAEDIINELNSNDYVFKRRVQAPLVYENCTIRGDLNLFNLKDPKTNEIIIKRPLNFSKSVFLGRISSWDQSVRLEDQPRVLFKHSVDFSNCYFENHVNLDKAIFRDKAYFGGTHFLKMASFTRAKFEKKASFHSARFDERALFHKTVFKGDVIFDMAIFNWLAFFHEVKIGSTIITVYDFSDWGALLSVVKGDTNDFPVKLLKSNLGDEEFNKIKSVSDASDLTDLMRDAIVKAFNDIINDLNFYSEEASQITLEDNTEAKDRFNELVGKGIFHIDKEVWKINDDLYLSQSDEEDIKWFNIAVLRQVYPKMQIETKEGVELLPVMFSDVVFSEDVIFSGATFHNVAFGNVQTKVYLGMDTIFRKEADFRNTTFDTLKLRDVVFQSEVDFSGSKFNEVVDITDLDIGKASVKIGWDQFIDTKTKKPKFEWQDAFENGELDENRTDITNMACSNFLSFLDLLKKNFQK